MEKGRLRDGDWNSRKQDKSREEDGPHKQNVDSLVDAVLVEGSIECVLLLQLKDLPSHDAL